MLKNFDVHHWIITGAFFLGLGGAVTGVVQGLPPGMSGMQYALLVVPAFMALANTIYAFFKNPPKSEAEALAEGENAAGKAGSHGFARIPVLVMLAAFGLAGLLVQLASDHRATVAMTGQGCSGGWWSKNQNVVVQDVNKDAQCVLGAILGGAASPAAVVAQCVNLTESQVLSIAASLFNYYVLGQQDGGLAGAAMPPYRGIPSGLDGPDLGKLRAFVGD